MGVEYNIFLVWIRDRIWRTTKNYRQYPLPPDKNKLKIVNSFLTRLWCTEYLEKKEILFDTKKVIRNI